MHLALALVAVAVAAAQTARAAEEFGHGSVYVGPVPGMHSLHDSITAGMPFLVSYMPAAGAIANVSWHIEDASTDATSGVPGTCSTASVAGHGRTLRVVCTRAAQYRVDVTAANVTDTVYVKVEPSAGCYNWHVARVGGEGRSTQLPAMTATVQLRVWIVDRDGGVVDEVTQKSLVPSPASAALTKAFYSLGERPHFSAYHDRLFLINIDSLTWDDHLCCWLLSVGTGQADTIFLTVAGQSLALLNCNVQDTTVALTSSVSARTLPWSAPPAAFNSTAFLLDDNSHNQSLVSLSMSVDACSTSTRLFTSAGLDSFAFVATDAAMFQTKGVRIIDGIASVQQAVLTHQGFVFVNNDGRLVAWREADAQLLTPDGLPDFSLTSNLHITGAVYCDHRSLMLVDSGVADAETLLATDSVVLSSNLLFAWSGSVTNDPKVYASLDGGASFTPISLVGLALEPGKSYAVLSVAALAVIDGAAVLVRQFNATLTGYVDRVIIAANVYGTLARSVTLSFSFPEQISNGDRRIVSFAHGGNTLLVYGSDGIYYSPNGFYFHKIDLVSRDPERPAPELSIGETIVDVVTSRLGEFAALTSTNRVFYGKDGMTETLELLTGLSPSDVATVAFDSAANLFAYALVDSAGQNFAYDIGSVVGDAPVASWQLLPHTQTHSWVAPLELHEYQLCTIAEFESSLKSDVYLDINERVQFSAFVRPSVGSSNNNLLSVSFSNRSLVGMTVVADELQPLGSVTARNVTYLLDTSNNTDAGKTEMHVVANGAAFSCDYSSLTSLLRVACPPGRFMELMQHASSTVMNKISSLANSDGECTQKPDGHWTGSFDFTIPATYWSDPVTGVEGANELTATYNCSLYGPPVSVFYSDSFYPQLGRFEYSPDLAAKLSLHQSRLIDLAQMPVAIMEVNGRNSYTFNATNADVGCKYPGQTWAEFRDIVNDGASALTLFNAWNSSSYVDCMDDRRAGISSSSMTDAHQLVTAGNAIRWSGSQDGYYVFRARVVDPSYSFCDMPVYFGVKVYGAPIMEYIQASVVFGIMTAVGAALVASYFWYRNSRRDALPGYDSGWTSGQIPIAPR